MLATLIVALAADPLITFECAGRPLAEVLAKLEPMVGTKLYVSGELADQPVAIVAQKQPWSDLQKDLAWAFRASWKHDTLARTEDDKRAIEDLVRAQNREDWRRTLDQYARASKDWGPWTDDDLKRSIADVDSETPRRVDIQAGYQILLRRGADWIAGIKPGDYFMYPPVAGEKPFPADCLPIVKQALIDTDRCFAVQRFNAKKATAFALFFTDVGPIISIICEGGAWGGCVTLPGPVFNPPTTPVGDKRILELSPRAIEVIKLRRATREGGFKPSVATAAALLDPKSVDPSELITGEALVTIAKSSGRTLVATPSFFLSSRFAVRTQIPVPEMAVLTSMNQQAEVEFTTGKLRVRNHPEVSLFRARNQYGSVAKAMREARDSQTLAEALFRTRGWESLDRAELLVPQRLLNLSLEATTYPEGAEFFFGDGKRLPSGRVQLTEAMRAAIQKILDRSPGLLEITRPPRSVLAGPGESSAVGAVQESGAVGYYDFRALPKRAFPNGIPREAEFEVVASDSDPYSYAETYLIGPREDKSGATRMSAYQYGLKLKELRGGTSKDAPKFFWIGGQVGGNLTIRFPGGFRMKVTCYARAVHPDEPTRLVSDLPESFRKTAEEVSKLNFGNNPPPPNSR